MQRRDLLATTSSLPGLDPAYLAAKEELTGGKALGQPVPRQRYGRTEEKLSIIGYIGINDA